jgi:DNA replication protein DnaD
MGIMRLSKSHSAEIMEAASQKALEKNTYSFKYFSIILKTGGCGLFKAEQ